MSSRPKPEFRTFEKMFSDPAYGEFEVRFTATLELYPSKWRLPRLEIRAWSNKPRDERDREHQSKNGDALLIIQRYFFSSAAEMRAWLARYTEARLREELGVQPTAGWRFPDRAFDRAMLELDDWLVAWARERNVTNYERI
jgi:hypothetical protein